MSLALDKRQRAMLREMGVRVWQPLHAPDPKSSAGETEPATQQGKQIATKNVATGADDKRATGRLEQKMPVADLSASAAVKAVTSLATTAESAAAAPRKATEEQPVAIGALLRTPATPSTPVTAAAAPDAVSWQTGTVWGVGIAQLLYAATGAENEQAKTGARWLVLAEVPAAALQLALDGPSAGFNAFDGDAGRLLDNMLRAARLPSARSVHLVAIARGVRPSADAALPAGNTGESITVSSDLAAALPALLAAAQPDLVLVMGRFAGQALLQTDVPFGKLRGQTHSLLGKPVIVTYDAAYLLRQQLEKARAWDDLRRAMVVAARAAG